MADVVTLTLLVAIAVTLGWVVTLRVLPAGKQITDRGTWRRTQETKGNHIRVLLVREHEGKETGRLEIREIDSNDPDWANKYTEAIAEADNRLAALESGEQR